MAVGSQIGMWDADLGNGGARRVVCIHVDHVWGLRENWHAVVDTASHCAARCFFWRRVVAYFGQQLWGWQCTPGFAPTLGPHPWQAGSNYWWKIQFYKCIFLYQTRDLPVFSWIWILCFKTEQLLSEGRIFRNYKNRSKNYLWGNSLVVQWLGCWAFTHWWGRGFSAWLEN